MCGCRECDGRREVGAHGLDEPAGLDSVSAGAGRRRFSRRCPAEIRALLGTARCRAPIPKLVLVFSRATSNPADVRTVARRKPSYADQQRGLSWSLNGLARHTRRAFVAARGYAA